MLKLEGNITLTEAAIKAPNLCDRFTATDLQSIGEWCHHGYRIDEGSRSAWLRRTEAGMSLAMQITKGKNFPWPNCSNVAFPVVTIAVLQFHATAYPAIINGPNVVRTRTYGNPTPQVLERAERISSHMSYQLLEQDQDWEEQHDRCLINIGCVGTAFKKSYWCESDYPESDLVMAKDLVMDYYSKSVESCPRKTHLIPLFRNEVYERAMRGTFRKDVLNEDWFLSPQAPKPTPGKGDQDKRHGVTQPLEVDETTPFVFGEQHVNADLDGDGYLEPYIITFELNSKCVVRIVANINRPQDIERNAAGKIVSIRSHEYFTKYGFIPSPDGGIYDIGFGVLLGPINESTNSAINQLFDAGTMATMAGGFLGRGAKIRGGTQYFSPFGWNRVDSTGEDLQKSIFPLPVREPSMVLFQLLSLLINYANRVSGATDMMVGESPGQNTPAETSRTMVQMGMKIYNAIFKRVWRSMKEEFKKIYILNGLFLPVTSEYSGMQARREDYTHDPGEVCPVADPNVSSDAEAFNRARALKEAAMSTPGYDLEVVERKYLQALRVPDIDAVFPGTKKIPPPPNVKLQIEQLRAKTKQIAFQGQLQQTALKLLEEHRLNTAKIAQLQAQAAKLLAEAGSQQAQIQLQAFNAMIGAMHERNDTLLRQIELFMQGVQDDATTEGGSRGATIPGESTRTNGGGIPELEASSGDEGLAIPPEVMEGGGEGLLGISGDTIQ